jgi:hypothetical protein
MVSQSCAVPNDVALARMVVHFSKSILANDILQRVKFVSAVASIDVNVSVSLVSLLCLLLHQQNSLLLFVVLVFLS